MISTLLVVVACVLDTVVWQGDVTTRTGGDLPIWLPAAVMVLAHQCLWWRRSRPWTVLGIEVALACVTLIVPRWQPFAGLLIALFAVASHRPIRRSAFAVPAVLAPFAGQAAGAAESSSTPMPTFAMVFGLFGIVVAVTWGLGAYVRIARERHARLRELERHRAEHDLSTERLRIARELHDGVAGAVTGMLMQAAGSKATAEGSAHQSLTAIEGAAARTLDELRLLLGDLGRCVVTAQPTTTLPTLDDLPDVFGAARDLGLRVTPKVTGTPGPLPPAVGLAAFRVVQEGLTNTAKYAGADAICCVQLDWQETTLVIDLTDDGAARGGRGDGALVVSGGRGLPGLSDRVASLGGRLEHGPGVGGYRLRATLPRPRPDLFVSATSMLPEAVR